MDIMVLEFHGSARFNYFVGPGLDELIEQLMQNDRHGPPPASQSSIHAMPTIKINQKHLHGDSHCPVCKERFEIGSEAREMPCKHSITLSASSHGWNSITRVGFAVVRCQLRVLAVAAVQDRVIKVQVVV
ncbi:Zinc finger, C3HC4 type (RING finger) [Musa troglodytarum]|uniref:Zinc finger, C3HC4 type (RING finger) n=1 Tax=Musa troglodytarum TaxID=320322 RepID=A0A9E7HR16_9LILI|nr:Zinc finger, C3HC4 type (RING finger) [Musa troglodytarum]